MAAPSGEVAAFGVWLSKRLEELEIDEDVYGSYINGILREEENEEEKSEALQAILSAFMDEDSLAIICKDIIQKWSETTNNTTQEKNVEDEVHAIASMIEKQAQIVVKQKDASEEEKSRKAAVLAQYANITDEEDEDEEAHGTSGFNFDSDKSLFKNTNVESVLIAKKAEREKARGDAQKKKEQDKLQREKDKLAKQERKEKEKKRTQKGERKR
ncbi:coiled-coil domain-containing protein 43 [Carcharodon carcharias]|uniref:coiled-coil domain-containing protein 43 n=1 Tax=Carcharodon carcharias TaxID=13397 RepID=UPI001B7EF5A7|nr:coiled-coil domain-containing protein 43 [Carcharodon carcharias]